MIAFIILISIIASVYLNAKYELYLARKESERLEQLEREIEEQRFDALCKLMFD